MKKQFCAAALSLLLLLLPACGGGSAPQAPVETVDPYAGMVQVESGFGTKMWVEEYEELPVNALTSADFLYGEYTGNAYTVRRGIDVSEHQGEIDWAAVADSGVEFAVIRAGYRGYGQAGTLHVDQFFFENMNGALGAGIDIGIYFFSQATGAAEAEEEADFLLGLLGMYIPETFPLPVYYDWETIFQDTARTDGMDGKTITECAAAFCKRITEAGYRAGLYAYRNLGYFSYDLRELKDYSLWIGAVGDYPDFYYAHELWQYSYTGRVPGIAGDVDLDFLFLPNPVPGAGAAEAAAESESQSE